MEIDAFMVSNARASVLLEMEDVFYWATTLPSLKFTETPYDVVLCTGGSWIVTCSVPKGMTVRNFVHELCARATHRYPHPASPCLICVSRSLPICA